jgi:hypothetical protein
MRLDNGSFWAHCCGHVVGEPLPMHSLFPFLGACFPKPYRVLQLQVQQEVRHKAYLLGVCQRQL